MPKVRGSFVFRDEGDDCLTSKYNNENAPPYVECCKRINGSSNLSTHKFVGDYNTVWLEEVKGTVLPKDGTLKIEVSKAHSGSYELTWTAGSQSYKGVGMLVDGLLVGGYWSS